MGRCAACQASRASLRCASFETAASGLYCRNDGKKHLHCSRAAAAANLQSWAGQFPQLALADHLSASHASHGPSSCQRKRTCWRWGLAEVQWNLHVPAFVIFLWLACVLVGNLLGFSGLALQKRCNVRWSVCICLYLSRGGAVKATLVCRGFTLLALYFPAGYVAYALIRHVDTPLLAPSACLCMVMCPSLHLKANCC